MENEVKGFNPFRRCEFCKHFEASPAGLFHTLPQGVGSCLKITQLKHENGELQSGYFAATPKKSAYFQQQGVATVKSGGEKCEHFDKKYNGTPLVALIEWNFPYCKKTLIIGDDSITLYGPETKCIHVRCNSLFEGGYMVYSNEHDLVEDLENINRADLASRVKSIFLDVSNGIYADKLSEMENQYEEEMKFLNSMPKVNAGDYAGATGTIGIIG